jgi:hypothetical protein
MKDPLLVVARAKPLRAPSTLHSKHARALQMVAEDVHRAVARVERGAVAGVGGAAIVPDGAAARGDADPEPQAVARVQTPAFWSAACEHGAHGEVEGPGCLRVQLRTVGKRMRGLPAMGARCTRCCCSTARATKPQARAERGGRGPSAAERADCVMSCALGGGARKARLS